MNTKTEKMKIALFASKYAHQDSKSEERTFRVCRKIDEFADVYMSKNLFSSFSDSFQEQLSSFCILFDRFPSVDMAVSVGGDGTFLRTAAIIGSSGIPVLGINTGRLGFLADIHFEEIDATFSEIEKKHFDIEERTLLSALTPKNKFFPNGMCALNEVAILKQDTASMLTIHAHINGRYLTSYQSDGLVIATPTGSTAYALSIGGSILAPTTPSFILAAIAPHSLTARPLVVDDESHISLQVESRSSNYLISLDGQSHVFSETTSVDVCKAPYTLKVVKRHGHSFFETLREKLMWGKDVRV